MEDGHSKAPDPRWDILLSTERLRTSKVKVRSPFDARSGFENDYDRIIFSSSFRRLKNKAQVFSLEGHDFVRTRLTHSIEVSTIGRALGEGVAKNLGLIDPNRDVGSLVATVCLLHDIGNPPFGHSGEWAIGSWFQDKIGQGLEIEDPQEIKDLTKFEGNAQALRIATRTQWSGLDFGMNLTAACLSTLIKYPCASPDSQGDKGPKALSKFGYFKRDRKAFEEVREKTGLEGHQRHPLTLLVEAADDIAYATGDIEDVLKKDLVKYEMIDAVLKKNADEKSAYVVKKYLDGPLEELAFVEDDRERRQLAIQRFSQMAVRLMIQSGIACFVEHSPAILNGTFDGEIVQKMDLAHICSALKSVTKDVVFPHLEIAYREQAARRIIHGLLDGVADEIKRNPKGTLSQTVYPEAPRNPGDADDCSKGYLWALRLTDYVSGMTDAFALAQYQRMNAMGIHL